MGYPHLHSIPIQCRTQNKAIWKPGEMYAVSMHTQRMVMAGTCLIHVRIYMHVQSYIDILIHTRRYMYICWHLQVNYACCIDRLVPVEVYADAAFLLRRMDGQVQGLGNTHEKGLKFSSYLQHLYFSLACQYESKLQTSEGSRVCY